MAKSPVMGPPPLHLNRSTNLKDRKGTHRSSYLPQIGISQLAPSTFNRPLVAGSIQTELRGDTPVFSAF
jgi:hypothetical protein